MTLTLDDCLIDLDKRRVLRGEEQLRLTATEVALLRYLLAHPHRVIAREELYRNVWEHQAELETRTLDLTVFRLRKKIEKDPRNPVHVMTVYGTGYTFVPKGEDAQPLSVLDTARDRSTRTNLGREENGFFGREEEQKALNELMEGRSGFITIVGLPGTGKTRLAKHWAAEHLVSEAVTSAWFCDLVEARTEEGVIHAVASALGVALTTATDAAESPTCLVGNAIERLGSTLVVIDNAEQVLQWVGPMVEAWWKQADQARFIVTSQIALGVAMEQRFPLSPLRMTSLEDGVAPSPAVQLFVDRAQSVRPSFELTDDNKVHVAAIVNALDGLPLAIELAASRVHLMPPATLYERLEDRFRVLKRPQQAGPTRHQTLRASLDWSWDLLEPWEQAAFAQCGVFHGGFDWEAVESVVDVSSWSDAPWSVDVVAELIERSLVTVHEDASGMGRLSMLTSVAEYARMRLAESEASEVQEARNRHANHFAQFGSHAYIDSLSVTGGVARLWRLKGDLENLLAGFDSATATKAWDVAADCALAAAEVFRVHGPFSDALPLLHGLLSRPVCLETRVRLLHKHAWLLLLAGRDADAIEQFALALAAVREAGNRHYEAHIMTNLATLHSQKGRFEEAREYYERALVVAREAENRQVEGTVLTNLASLNTNRGQYSEAMAQYQQAIAIDREVGNHSAEGITLGNLANVYCAQGYLSEALEHHSQALEIHREVGNRRQEGITLGNIGDLRFDLGDIQAAEADFQESLEIHREVGNRRFESITLGNIGNLQMVHGDPQLAEANLQQSIAIGDEVWPMMAAIFRGYLAILRAKQGVFVEARAILDRSEAGLRGLNQLEFGKLLCKRAEVECLAGDVATANIALAEAESIAGELQVRPESLLATSIAEIRRMIAAHE